MKRLMHILLLAVLLALPAAPSAYAVSRGWETLRKERPDAHSVAKDVDIEIQTAGGMLLVSTQKVAQIKVYTILGQLVNSETLQPGTYQFRVPSHGVYIVKVGDLTCKVVI